MGIISVKNPDKNQLIPNITDQEIKYLESKFGYNIKYGFTHLKEHQEMDGIAYGTMMQNGDEIILSKEGWAYLAGNTKQIRDNVETNSTTSNCIVFRLYVFQLFTSHVIMLARPSIVMHV